jgi:hypothetical protein
VALTGAATFSFGSLVARQCARDPIALGVWRAAPSGHGPADRIDAVRNFRVSLLRCLESAGSSGLGYPEDMTPVELDRRLGYLLCEIKRGCPGNAAALKRGWGPTEESVRLVLEKNYTRSSLLRRFLRGALLAQFVVPALAAAQTDFYNTDAGRPVRIEDAYPTERYAFELQIAPLRLERARGGTYNWGFEPELTYGILPRTHLEVGAPLAYTDLGGSGKRAGLAGIDISVLHNLNIESRTLPAFGVLGEVLVPAGGLGPDKAYPSVKAIATRTYRWARFHVNGQYTFGSAPDGTAGTSAGASGANIGPGAVELSRWLAGAAVDRTFPLRSMLLTAEAFARQPIASDDKVEWNAGAGVRYQLTPTFSLDAGAGKRLTGEDQSWYVTFGLARAFAIRSLMPAR